VRAPEIELSGDFILHMDGIDSQFFAMPLNQERNHYYINNKRFGMNVTGAY